MSNRDLRSRDLSEREYFYLRRVHSLIDFSKNVKDEMNKGSAKCVVIVEVENLDGSSYYYNSIDDGDQWYSYTTDIWLFKKEIGEGIKDVIDGNSYSFYDQKYKAEKQGNYKFVLTRV